MSRRIHHEDERDQVDRPRAAVPASEPAASPAAVFDAAGRTRSTGRGAGPAIGRAIDGLQGRAGNGAVARLFGGTGGVAPVMQRLPDDETPAADAGGTETPAADATGTATAGGTAADAPASALAAGAPAAGPSWTKVGPPTNGTYSVSGTLREVSNAVAARPEAGSVTATPSADTESWTPDGGSEQISAARVTVAQVVELPTWTDRTKATPNQQAEWDRFHRAITTHEAGHVSTDKTAFAGVHSRMVGKTPTEGDTELDTATAKAKTDNDTYDTGNDHGRKEGTGINPNVDEVTKVP